MNLLPPLALAGHEIGLIFGLGGMAVGMAFGLFGMYIHHRRRSEWHELAKLALEKGQPLPPMSEPNDCESDTRSSSENDIRSGLICLAVGIGLFVFFHGMNLGQLRWVGAIPACVGVALLLLGVFKALRGNAPTDSNLPPRS